MDDGRADAFVAVGHHANPDTCSAANDADAAGIIMHPIADAVGDIGIVDGPFIKGADIHNRKIRMGISQIDFDLFFELKTPVVSTDIEDGLNRIHWPMIRESFRFCQRMLKFILLLPRWRNW